MFSRAWNRALKAASTAVLGCAAFSLLGIVCRTWLYQPPVPQKILDMDS